MISLILNQFKYQRSSKYFVMKYNLKLCDLRPNDFYCYTLEHTKRGPIFFFKVWICSLLLELKFSLKKVKKEGEERYHQCSRCLLVVDNPLPCFQCTQRLCSDCSPSLLFVSCLFFCLSSARNSVPLESKKNNPDPRPSGHSEHTI